MLSAGQRFCHPHPDVSTPRRCGIGLPGCTLCPWRLVSPPSRTSRRSRMSMIASVARSMPVFSIRSTRIKLIVSPVHDDYHVACMRGAAAGEQAMATEWFACHDR